MKFLCICMSPAIDANVSLEKAPRGEGEIFKNLKTVENAGGKTINVARWLAIRGAGAAAQDEACEVVCAGLLGEDNATLFEKEFSKYGIVDKMTRVNGATRRNEMITWPDGSFKLNQAAFEGVKFDEDEFLEELVSSIPRESLGVQRIDESLGAHEFCAILSGSLPKCCSVDFYAKAVKAFNAAGAFVVLDASGEAMKRALAAKPDLIKPNAEECEDLIGFIPKTPEEFQQATARLREFATHVINSDGGAGAWFDGEFIAAPQVECIDTTSAGDTLLAEYCFSKDAKCAVAAGSAAVEMPGSNPPSVDRVKELAAQIK